MINKATLKETIVAEIVAGEQLEVLKERYPTVSARSWYNYKEEAEKQLKEECKVEQISEEQAFSSIANSANFANNLAKHVCIVLVLLLLSANFFTIQEVSSKVFSIAPITGYCIAFAVTLTPVAVIFTNGSMILRIGIQLIAFCIEVICNVVVVAESPTIVTVTQTTGLSNISFAWIAGIAIPLFALLCNIYLNQLQNENIVSVQS